MRSRNFKPGLFLNEKLGQEDPMLTLVFLALMGLADREGILEDRPIRIKAAAFPYRNSLDIHRYLTDLSRYGFIRRYQVGGLELIHIVNFKKHQSPHHTERKSVYPLPSAESSDTSKITVSSPLDNGGNPPDSLNHESCTTDSPKQENNVPPPVEEKPKRVRRSKEEKISGFSDQVREVVNTLGPQWRTEDPVDGRKITQDVGTFAQRISEILAAHPEVTHTHLIEAGAAYIASTRNRYKAPQFFFGPGMGSEGPPWLGYVRSIMTRKETPRELAS